MWSKVEKSKTSVSRHDVNLTRIEKQTSCFKQLENWTKYRGKKNSFQTWTTNVQDKDLEEEVKNKVCPTSALAHWDGFQAAVQEEESKLSLEVLLGSEDRVWNLGGKYQRWREKQLAVCERFLWVLGQAVIWPQCKINSVYHPIKNYQLWKEAEKMTCFQEKNQPIEPDLKNDRDDRMQKLYIC